MSFNDPGYLFSNRPTENEREATRLAAEQRRESVKRNYHRANNLVVLTMLYIALPLGLQSWHWHVVIGAGCLLGLLAILMLMKGARSQALITLVFAAVILPGWIKVAPAVVKIIRSQAEAVMKEWKKVL